MQKEKKSSNREGSMVVGEVDSTDSMKIHYWKIIVLYGRTKFFSFMFFLSIMIYQTDPTYIIWSVEKGTWKYLIKCKYAGYVNLRSMLHTLHQQSRQGIKEWDPSFRVPPFYQQCSYSKWNRRTHKTEAQTNKSLYQNQETKVNYDKQYLKRRATASKNPWRTVAKISSFSSSPPVTKKCRSWTNL